MKAGERRERTLARARTDILDAAIRAFVRSGLHGTTMQDIAREAGYTAASLYTYFGSKQEIIVAMANQLTDEYIQVFEQPVPSGLSFRQRFELVLHRHLELVEKRRSVFIIFVADETNGEPRGVNNHDSTFHNNFERRIARLSEWLQQNASPEDLGGHDPQIVARLLFGMAFGLLHDWRQCSLQQPQGSFLDYAPTITQFFFHGVSRQPKTGARKK